MPSEWIGSLNRMPSAVTTSAMPSVNVMTPLRTCATCAKCIHASVSAAAGRLPSARRRTTCQSTVPALWWTAVPKLLVMDAYSRSVPTAVVGATPNSITRMGVISAPPPTPVTPTMAPTSRPATPCMRSKVKKGPAGNGTDAEAAYRGRAEEMDTAACDGTPECRSKPSFSVLVAIDVMQKPRIDSRRAAPRRFAAPGGRDRLKSGDSPQESRP